MVLYKAVPKYPIIIAANRDEYYSRKAKRPDILQLGENGKVKAIAGQDAMAGGTWLGINQFGVIVGITNRSTGKSRDNSKKSRGALVLSCLEKRSTYEISEMLVHEDTEQYNPFNLFYADLSGAYLATNYEKKRVIPLLEEIGVLVNGDPENREANKQKRAMGLLRELVGRKALSMEDLKGVCSGHEGSENPLEPFCVHTENYGTVSSTIIFFSGELNKTKYFHCEGPPCQNAYQDYSPHLSNLFSSPS